MARIRTTKPEFWTDGDVMDLTPHARMLFHGSWNFTLCDYGHLPDDPRRLKMQVLPADDVMLVRDPTADIGWRVAPLDPAALVEEIIAAGRFARLVVDGRSYLHVVRFADHQRLDKRWTPRCPVCKAQANTPEPHGNSREFPRTRPNSPQDRTGQDRTGAAAAAPANAAAAPVENLPGEVEILRRKLEARKLTVRWDKLTPEQLDEIVALVHVHGDGPLIQAANLAYQPNNPIAFAQGWLSHWRALPPPGKLRAVTDDDYCPAHPWQYQPADSCRLCASEALAAGR